MKAVLIMDCAVHTYILIESMFVTNIQQNLVFATSVIDFSLNLVQ